MMWYIDDLRCLNITEASIIIGRSIRRTQALCKKNLIGKKIKGKIMLNKNEIDKLLTLKSK